jgi:nucleoside 2-deoxyribosyltransferase
LPKNRVYVAAPWLDRASAAEVATILECNGYHITHKWWIFEGAEEDTSWEFKQICARQDMEGVRTADVVVLLNTQKSEGKATEQGMAIAYGIPIIVLGDKNLRCNIFQTMPCFHWVDGTLALQAKLKEILDVRRNETV